MKVELVNITKRFGALVANNEVSALFEPGEVHGLLGENGAGKSTLMKVLAGWYLPEGGTIRLDDRDVRITSPRDAMALGVGYVPQDPQDFADLTVLEHLVIGTPGWGFRRARLADEIRRVNDQMGFTLDPFMRVRDVTVGQRLQLAMAQVIVQGASVIILDEPPMGSGLRDSLQRLAKEGKTVVFITHNIADAVGQCDRITVLRRGHKVGTAARPIDQGQLVHMMFEKQPHQAGRPHHETGPALADLQNASAHTDPALYEITMQAHGGEIVGLAGIEGSGQSSLLATLGGRGKVAGGTRTIQAKVPHVVPAGRMGEGLVDGFSVEEQLALAHEKSLTRGMLLDQKATHDLAEKSIHQFHLKGQPASLASGLSGGNQQRLMLASTPKNVDLLLLDNPTRGLDVPTAAFIWEWILHQCERGAGVVVASTEVEELWQHCNRILVMARGRIIGEVFPSQDDIHRLKHLISGADPIARVEGDV